MSVPHDSWSRIRAVVVGLKKSGYAATSLLSRLGVKVSVTESGPRQLFQPEIDDLDQWEITYEFSGHTREFITGHDMMIVSPGIPLDAEVITWAQEAAIPVVGELELAGMVCPAPIIAVTGTNGKTTTVSLISLILKNAGIDAVTCGNIGIPLSDVALDVDPDSIVVCEVSSFQLEHARSFRPWIAVILNISDNHFDRHKDMATYLEMKARIFRSQRPDDWTVLNSADPLISKLEAYTPGRVKWFAATEEFNEDYEAAMAVGSIVGGDRANMIEAVKRFKGVEHRCEEVAVINGIRCINDSKSTTPRALRWALDRTPGPVILIAGGQNKGMDFASLRQTDLGMLKSVILMGKDKADLRCAFEEVAPVSEADSLEAAVQAAWQQAANGDAILLSPGCASFDMFNNFEHRGEVFKMLIEQLVRCIPVK